MRLYIPIFRSGMVQTPTFGRICHHLRPDLCRAAREAPTDLIPCGWDGGFARCLACHLHGCVLVRLLTSSSHVGMVPARGGGGYAGTACAHLRHDPQLKIKSFSSNSYRGVFPNKQILRDYAENCAVLCPSANYESSLWVTCPVRSGVKTRSDAQIRA